MRSLVELSFRLKGVSYNQEYLTNTVNEIFNLADINKDDMISLNEFAHAVKQNHKLLHLFW